MFNFFLKQWIILAVIATTLVFGARCGGGANGTERPEGVFEGLITNVEASTLLDLESIEVSDDVGNARVFHAGGMRFTEFTPSHAREHMLQGEGVSVTYKESEDGSLYIVEIRDLPP